MPPTQRKTRNTASKTSNEAQTSNETEKVSETTERKARKPRVTSDDAVILTDFKVVSGKEAPKKHHARTNPYDSAVWESYEAKLADTDDFVYFETETEKVDSQVALIRSAAMYFDIGSKIRVEDLKNGRTGVYFRGQERRTRKSKNDEAKDNDTDNTVELAEAV